MPTDEEIVPIGGLPVRATTAAALVKQLIDAIPRRESRALFFANTNLVVHGRDLAPAMRAADAIVVNDGIGLSIAARLFHRKRFIENLNGTDFTPRLLAEAGRSLGSLRIVMIGARPATLRHAVAYVESTFGHRVVDAIDGFGPLDETAIVDGVRASDADLVLVALGNPMQEKWILRHRAMTQAGALIGVGALFDFWAGEFRRAPGWVRSLRLEWLFRLAQEPRRLARRYTLDIGRFLWICHRASRTEP